MKNKKSSKLFLYGGVLLIGALFVFVITQRVLRAGSPEMISAASPKSAGPSQPTGARTQVVPTQIDDPPPDLSPAEQAKWDELKQVLLSKNDNDPRVDKDLKNLSPEFHAQLFKQYQEFPMEKRNERGFVAFLVARDLQSPEDFQFLDGIFNERPCLSLDDCNTPSHSDPHLSSLDQTSANYPQMAALYQVEHQINSGNKIFNDPDARDLARQLLSQAEKFPVPMVQKKALQIEA